MHIKSLILGAAIALALPACAVNVNVNDTQLLGSETAEEDAILAVLIAQKAAWNAGDIDGFMDGYWVSDELRFASGGTVVKGWQATKDRYHARYTNRAIMGTLDFSELEVDLLAGDAAIVHGQWALQRETDRPSGLFTLVFKQIDGNWLIVSDTTTSAD